VRFHTITGTSWSGGECEMVLSASLFNNT